MSKFDELMARREQGNGKEKTPFESLEEERKQRKAQQKAAEYLKHDDLSDISNALKRGVYLDPKTVRRYKYRVSEYIDNYNKLDSRNDDGTKELTDFQTSLDNYGKYMSQFKDESEYTDVRNSARLGIDTPLDFKKRFEEYTGTGDKYFTDDGIRTPAENLRVTETIRKDGAKNANDIKWLGKQIGKFSDAIKYEDEQERLNTADLASLQEQISDLDKQIESETSRRDAYTNDYKSKGGFVPQASNYSRPTSDQIPALQNYEAGLSEYNNKIDDLTLQRNQLSVFYNRAKNAQKIGEYENVASLEDFASVSGIGKASSAENWDDVKSYFHENDVTNPVQFVLDNRGRYLAESASGAATGATMSVGNITKNLGGTQDEWVRRIQAMTPDEVSVYNYYIGKGDRAKADEYLSALTETLDGRAAYDTFESSFKDNVALEYVFGLGAGIEQFTNGIKNIFTDEEYVPATYGQQMSQLIREDLADDGFKVLGSSIGQIGYDTVTTTANMLPSIAASTVVSAFNPVAGGIVGSALMGASAGGNAYAEMINLGYSKPQARTYAVLTGASEALLQELVGGIPGLGGVLPGKLISKFSEGINNAFARVAVSTLGNMISEGSEEFWQDVLDPYFKALATGETPEDIDWEQAIYSGILGAVSSLMLELPSEVANTTKTTRVGKEVKADTERFERLQKLGTTYSADSVAYKIASKVDNNTSAYTIGRLLNAVGAELTEQNQADIRKSLERKGIDSDSAATIAKWLAKAVDGKYFNFMQRRALDENPDIRQTFLDVIVNPNSTVYQRQAEVYKLSRSPEVEAESKKLDEVKAKAEAEKNVDRNPAPSVASAPAKSNVLSDKAYYDANPEEALRKKLAAPVPAAEYKGDFDIADDNKTVVSDDNGNARDVEIGKIASIEDGKMMLDVGEESPVNASDVSYADSNQALLYEGIVNVGMTADAGNGVINTLKNANLVNNRIAIQNSMLAYQCGLTNQRSELSSLVLPAEVRDTMFAIGRADAKTRDTVSMRDAVSTKKVLKSSSKVIYESEINRKTLNARQKATLDFGEELAKTTPLNVHIVDSVANADGNRYAVINGKNQVFNANGFYSIGTNDIYIDVNAGDDFSGLGIYTMAHEVSHYIRNWNATGWRTLADKVVAEIDRQAVNTDKATFNEMLERRYQHYKETVTGKSDTELRDMAYEDVVCDSLASLFTDKETFVEFANNLKSENQTLWNRLKTAIQNFLKRFEGIINSFKEDGAQVETDAARAIEKAAREAYEDIRSTFVAAFQGANEVVESKIDVAAKTAYEGGHRSFPVAQEIVGEFVKGYDEKKLYSLREVNPVQPTSAAENDAKYLSAVKSGNMETAQRMVEEAAKAAGYTADESWKMDHRAPNSEDDTAHSMDDINGAYGGDDSIYDKRAAYYYGEGRSYDGQAISVIRSARNNPDKPIKVYRAVPTDIKDTRMRNGDWVAIVKDYAEEHGDRVLDGDFRIIENTVPAKHLYNNGDSINEWGYDNGNRDEVYKNTESNVKLQTVTYDDEGNVIPLSERFNEGNNDIRYSERNKNIRSRKYWYPDMSIPEINLVKGMAKNEVTKSQNIIYNTSKWLYNNRNGTSYFAIYSTEDTEDPTVLYACKGIRAEFEKQLLQQAILDIRLDVTETESNGRILRQSEVIDKVLQSLKYASRSNSVYNGDSMGRNGNDGYDKIYSEFGGKRPSRAFINCLQNILELQQRHGVKLSERAEPTDNRTLLANALDSIATTPAETEALAKYKAEAANYNEQSEKLAQIKAEIKELSFGKGKRDTARIKALQDEARKMSNRLNIYDGRLLKLEGTKVLSDLLAREKDKVAKREKAKYREALAKTKAQRDVREQAVVIANNVKKMQQRLLSPTSKTAIPEVIAGPVARFLSTIDTMSYDKDGNARPSKINAVKENAREALAELAKSIDTNSLETEYGQLDVDPQMTEWVKSINEFFANGLTNKDVLSIYKMDSEQLSALNKFIRHLNKLINGATKMYTNMSSDIAETARSTIQHLEPLNKPHWSYGEKLAKIFAWDFAQPVTAFDRFGEGGKTIFNSLIGGQSKMAYNTKILEDFVEDAYTSEEAEAWQKDIVDVKIGDTTYQVTPAMLMGLHCLLKQTDSARHILEGGGVRFADVKSGKKTIRYTNTLFSDADASEIESKLTDRQREVAEKLQHFMEETGSKWGNEVSMIRFGYHAFTIKGYYPIRTTAANSEYEAQQKRANIYALLNKSFTKERIMGANNAVVVDDIFSVFANHMSEMALYNAWALPVIDTIKWFNYKETQDVRDASPEKSVRESLRLAYGKNADEYVRRLLESINSQDSGGLSEEVGLKNIRLVNRVAVAANLRVAVQQPFSITRAFEEINPKYVVNEDTAHLKRAYNEMLENSGMAMWKSLGYFDVNISRPFETKVKKNQSKIDKFAKKSMILAEAGDNFTWSVLWSACKRETKELNPDIAEDELLTKTANRFNDLICRTQVVDSVLTKSQWMRSNLFIHRMTSSFMSEPMTSYNALLRQYDKVTRTYAETGKYATSILQNRKSIATAVGIFALTQLINALVTAPLDAGRDDDDYETYLEKFYDAFKKNFAGNINVLNLMPYVQDVVECFQYGEATRPDLQIFVEGIDLGKNIAQMVMKPSNTTYFTWHKVAKSSLEVSSNLSGIPMSNIARDVVAIWNTVVGDIDNGRLKFQTAKDKNSTAYQKMYTAFVDGNESRAIALYSQLLSNTVEPKTIHTGVKKLIKQNYLDGKIDENEAKRLLTMLSDYTGKEVSEKILNKTIEEWNEKSK